ncbi:MAG: prolyl oligopeptidase family serine peptidase [Anaerolineae bacterium]|jgi:pimeloyl-ACP methyl ester carboxylesterase|nr:prolyl oligopeptidase family serine peptidase [Anaerolineae bacterium]
MTSAPVTTTPPHRRTRRYWTRLSCVFTCGLLLAVVGTPAAAGFISIYGLLHPPCGAHSQTPGDFGHTWEDITLTARAGGQMRAYYIPGTNRAAVIIPPPYGSGCGNRLHEADVLVRHGYAVLAFESRRCAGMGSHSLGYKETSEVADALDYLQTRDDIDPARIGVLGFSSAGATAVMAAAKYPGIRAVVAEGGYGDFADGAMGINSGGGTFVETIYKQAMRYSYRLITGLDIDKLSPIDMIDQIAPRPILLIYGSTERSLDGAKQQLAAAGDNAELWIVEGAGHGNYLDIAPEEYEQRVIAFFDAALLDGE